MKSHPMQHDPGLLLPVPLSSVGSFIICKGDFKVPHLSVRI